MNKKFTSALSTLLLISLSIYIAAKVAADSGWEPPYTGSGGSVAVGGPVTGATGPCNLHVDGSDALQCSEQVLVSTGTTGDNGVPSIGNTALTDLGININHSANSIAFNYDIDGSKYNFGSSRMSFNDSGNFTVDWNFDVGLSRKDSGVLQVNNGINNGGGAGFQMFHRGTPPATCDEGANGTMYFDTSDALCICMDIGGTDGWQKILGDGTCA